MLYSFLMSTPKRTLPTVATKGIGRGFFAPEMGKDFLMISGYSRRPMILTKPPQLLQISKLMLSRSSAVAGLVVSMRARAAVLEAYNLT